MRLHRGEPAEDFLSNLATQGNSFCFFTTSNFSIGIRQRQALSSPLFPPTGNWFSNRFRSGLFEMCRRPAKPCHERNRGDHGQTVAARCPGASITRQPPFVVLLQTVFHFHKKEAPHEEMRNKTVTFQSERSPNDKDVSLGPTCC